MGANKTPLLFWFGLTTFVSFTLFVFLEFYAIFQHDHGVLRSIRNRTRHLGLPCAKVKLSLSTANDRPSNEQKFETEYKPLTHYRLIDDYAIWHKKNRHCGKKLIWRCPPRGCGGLGDRIRSLVLTYAVAVVNERVFLIDWNDPVPLSDVLSPNLIDWRFDPEKDSPFWDSPPDPIKPTNPPAINYAKPEVILSLPNHTLILAERVAASGARVTNASSPRFRQLVKESKFPFHTDDFNRAVLQALFKTSPEMAKKMRRLRTALNIQNPYLAIHARVGVGVGEMKRYSGRFSKFANNLGIVAYRLAKALVDRKSAENITGSCSVFLATDTPALRPLFEEEFARQDKSIKLVGGDWVPHHYIESTSRNGSMKVAEKKAFWDTMLDLMMLGEAKTFSHLKSGFSDAALWLGDAQSCVQIRWGNRPHDLYRVQVRKVTRSQEAKTQTMDWTPREK